MSNLLIAFLLTIGSSAWVFSKLQNRSGRNTSQSLTAAGVSALIIFVVTLVILELVF